MSLRHAQAQDLLEGYALWSLDDADRAAVERHLTGCDVCRARARELEEVAHAIPESIVERAPTARLRDQVLAAARADTRPRARRVVPALFRPLWVASAAVLVIAVVSGGVAINTQLELQRVAADRDRYLAIVDKVSEAGRWWYMEGIASFGGSGGTLIDPRRDGTAFVLFHDLKPAPAGTRYTIWMIRPDSSWVRAVKFVPSGETLQRVDVPLVVSDFAQCAVTVETRDSGAPQGTLAMQSRVFAQ